MKFYAVRKGYRTGIFYDWDSCKSAVTGFPKAEYKSFKNEEDALHYLETGTVNNTEVKVNKNVCTSRSGETFNIVNPTSEDVANLFIDGSYKDGRYSCGIYIQLYNKDLHFCCNVSRIDDRANLRNIASEICAALVGIQLCNDLGKKRINLYYDYLGLCKWFYGEWRAKGYLQSLYANKMRHLIERFNLQVRFLHVKGHSGVDGNDIADKLANRARLDSWYVDFEEIYKGNITVNDVTFLKNF